MNQIKVIKKGAINKPDYGFKSVEEKSSPKSKGREAIKIVEQWIADWRTRTEIETRRSLGEITRVRLGNSTGT